MSVEYYYMNDLNTLYNASVGDKTDGGEHHMKMMVAHDNLEAYMQKMEHWRDTALQLSRNNGEAQAKINALEADYVISNRELLVKQVEIQRLTARIAELEKIQNPGKSANKRVRFPRENKFDYGQDFSRRCGIPSHVEFEVEDCGRYYVLTAPGYGLAGDYGNGALIVYQGSAAAAYLVEQQETPLDELVDAMISAAVDSHTALEWGGDSMGAYRLSQELRTELFERIARLQK